MDTRNSEADVRNARFNEDGSITCEVFMANRLMTVIGYMYLILPELQT